MYKFYNFKITSNMPNLVLILVLLGQTIELKKKQNKKKKPLK